MSEVKCGGWIDRRGDKKNKFTKGKKPGESENRGEARKERYQQHTPTRSVQKIVGSFRCKGENRESYKPPKKKHSKEKWNGEGMALQANR